MNQMLKQMLLAFMCLFALTGQAIADQLADAELAYNAKDYEKAANLFLPLAEQGNDRAFLLLTVISMGEYFFLCENEHFVCMRWYQLEANHGDASAQDFIGSAYRNGMFGVVQNYEEAIKWFRLSSKQNCAEGQYDMGLMYAAGTGVHKDDKEAAKWWRLAAKNGNYVAQRGLGFIYDQGRGVPQDYVLSYMWYSIAAAANNFIIPSDQPIIAEERDSIAKKMTAQQITEAQELARKCTANKFKGC